ncbi:hypothetical protein N7448_007461 [Penicillium atrosanguineum]|uniref:NADP-dependent oxidoreductase domain-containing protein n=1 Tax=Penicillium atrosanguineum TaxID=1132637 RepID=A0A9W9QDS4_9EURO|nr:uncharacterized protein N7443_001513 [Penicillium atrosanguineum]KAJ5126682.1 hypothetical protein N7448_007461 [Penicillium atrosanguineum]KAJ5146887.1 hypothetical protein N7526_000239 [Penicillium atrosanguineum]KAJ5314629.1 hypothetical protein N7443_001513 [Penicillium atrosanguineum]KAJ5331800.1 hypothetical protein N7476_001583 [Penicillium atrosanguineum]
MSRPNTIFGGGLIGTSFTTPVQVQELLDKLKALKIDRIDTAARYSPTNPGSSERLLGEVRAAEQGFTIDTKINSGGSASSDGSGSLTAAAINKSIDESFNRLKVDKVDILYFHRPDPQTPIAEQAAEIQRQYLAGRFEKFGLSNFPPELLAEFLAVCEKEDYIKPSVYQGLYNLLSRQSEKSLFPLLRQHGIAFYAYSPLAGGFLTGRATRGDVEGTRYAADNQIAKNMNAMYDKPDMHEAMTDLLDTIEPLQISGSEACLRWLYYHSILRESDGVILGASKVPQIVQNANDVSKGLLPLEVVHKIDTLWEKIRS